LFDSISIRLTGSFAAQSLCIALNGVSHGFVWH
jgi:hypothetical protein